MKISSEVVKWLKDNAYAVKGNDCWLMRDFPTNDVPDRLHIPIISKRTWRKIRETEALENKKE